MAGFIELSKAVREDNINRVKRLVCNGTDVNCRNSFQETVLHHAAVFGNTRMVKLLVRLGAQVNAVDISGHTPLHYASTKEAIENIKMNISNNFKFWKRSSQMTQKEKDQEVFRKMEEKIIEMIECLLNFGADINAATYVVDGTSLNRAVRLKNIQAIQVLTQLGVDVKGLKMTGCTALNMAIGQGHLSVIKRLVELGVDLNSAYCIETPLFTAVRDGRADIVETLVQNGADVNTKKVVFSASSFIMFRCNQNIALSNEAVLHVIECLAKAGTDLNISTCSFVHIIHEAVKYQQIEILRYLVNHGANVNAVKKSYTPLVNAVICNDHNLIDFLVKCGADVNTCCDCTASSLSDAISQGNIEMVKTLLELGASMNGDDSHTSHVVESTSALNVAVKQSNTETVKILLRLGADINKKYELFVTPLHHAVTCGDCDLLKALCHLKLNVNAAKHEGYTVLHNALRYGSKDNLAIVKALVEAGADLNAGYNEYVTPLHDAVRLSDIEMVKTLSNLGANMDSMKTEGIKPLHLATYMSKRDVLEYFAQLGVDMEATHAEEVRPLHDAVRQGNIDMVKCLERCGANVKACKKDGLTAMFAATISPEEGAHTNIKCLVKLGANINSTINKEVSALHDAVKLSNIEMMKVLVGMGLNVLIPKVKWSLLHISVALGSMEVTECLLGMGINTHWNQDTSSTPLEEAISHNDVQSFLTLLSLMSDSEYLRITVVSDRNIKVEAKPELSSPFELACRLGHFDLIRSLIIAGHDLFRKDHHGKMPLEYLPLSPSINYHVLHETATSEKVVERVGNESKSQHRVLCQNVESLHCTTGIGDVRYIPSLHCRKTAEEVFSLLKIMSGNCRRFSCAGLKGIGGTAEGTKVGLPNEMDFLLALELDPTEKVTDAGFGFAHYVNQSKELFKEGSRSFHTIFEKDFNDAIACTVKNQPEEVKVRIVHTSTHFFLDNDRKACSLLNLQTRDLKLAISVDVVPCLHVNNWPERAIHKTWLMEYDDLKNRGYILVPKPPHIKSALAKRYTKKKLDTLWRISFAHLETEHLQQLEKWVKDVYVTAKSIRNPDICRILISEDGPGPKWPRPVDKYITSYLLKMMFLKNVENFLNSRPSLGAMVCKVYDDLEEGLSQEHIPLFFMPSVNALDGLKLDVPKCAKVAKMMKEFVNGMYIRDCQEDDTDSGDDQEIIAYQRKPRTVYQFFEISH